MNYNYLRHIPEKEMNQKGVFYIVSTPIGNLEDMTLRGIRILKESDLIAAEDTRTAQKLLKHYSIQKKLLSYNQHNKIKRTKQIIDYLYNEGKKVSLISEAGTPGIQDPGYHLINEVIKNQIEIIPIPGCSALLAGLVVSGFPINSFLFEGFLPSKKGRKKKIRELGKEDRTIVLFESPHRLRKSIIELYEAFGNRKIVIARELTKKFEEILHFTLEEAVEYYEERSIRGEFVLIISSLSYNKKRENQEIENKIYTR